MQKIPNGFISPQMSHNFHTSLQRFKASAHVLVKPWFATPPCTFQCFVRKVKNAHRRYTFCAGFQSNSFPCFCAPSSVLFGCKRLVCCCCATIHGKDCCCGVLPSVTVKRRQGKCDNVYRHFKFCTPHSVAWVLSCATHTQHGLLRGHATL